MAFTTITPILRILDEAKAKEFYVDFLGFKIDWEHRAEGPLYMQVSLGECVLHLSEHSGDCCPGAAIKLHTDDIEEYVEELVAKEYPPGVAGQDLGVAEQPWGSLDMLLMTRSAIGSFSRMLESDGPDGWVDRLLALVRGQEFAMERQPAKCHVTDACTRPEWAVGRFREMNVTRAHSGG